MTRTSDLADALLAPNKETGKNDGAEITDDVRFQAAIPSFRQFPVDALPARMARFVRSVAGATTADPSWAALAALAVVAGCVGNRAAVTLKRGWVEPAILWAALVGKSGSVKSVVLHLVTRPLVELYKQERDTFERNMKQYDADVERHNAAMQKWKSDQKTGPPTDPPVEPEKPREKRVLVSDVTIEKLAALLGENPLGLLVVRDELAGLINSFDRYSGGKGSDLQSWLSMNDAGPLLVDRKSDGSTFVDRASVSLLGTIQPFTLEHVFGTVEREAGLLARVLLAYPPAVPALWTEDELSDDVAADWHGLLVALLAIEPARDDADRPRPRLIGLSHAAKPLFVTWHDRHAREVADLADDHLRAYWSKLKGVCVRIALLFACTEVVGGTRISSISSDCLSRAIRVTEWLKHESNRIYTGLHASDADRKRSRLVDWIIRRGGGVTVNELAHNDWQFRGDSPAARAALNGLVESGVARWVRPPPGPNGGCPAERLHLLNASDITITDTPSDDATSGGSGDGDVGDGSGGSEVRVG